MSSLPWAELHVHIEGTLEPALIFDRAAMNNINPGATTVRDLEERYRFRNLQDFLNLYYDNMTVLCTEDDFAVLTLRYLERAHRNHIGHVELFVDPQAHLHRGVAVQTVLRGVRRGLKTAEARWGISGGIIVCVLRDQPVVSAEAMLDAALASGVPLLGLGLDSAEVGYPPSLFRSVFDHARSQGLHVVAHAGEEAGPEYVWEALDILGAERIDHGVRALEESALMHRIVADEVPLTLCPLSNVSLRVVSSVSELPLRRMLDEGVRVTVNSDDPAYFGGYLQDNVTAVRDAFDLDAASLEQLRQNSILASFLTGDRRNRLMEG